MAQKEDARPAHKLLFRDILDNQLTGRNGTHMGMVDGIVLQLRDGAPPRVIAIECGGIAPARRLPKWIGGILMRAARRWGAQNGEPFRIAWSKVRDIGVDIDVDVDAALTPALHWEHVVRERVVRKIPGA